MSFFLLTVLRVFVLLTFGFFVERLIHTPSGMAHLRQRLQEDAARRAALDITPDRLPRR